MRISNEDVSALASVVCLMRTIAAAEQDVIYKDHLNRLTDRTRKIYILLLETTSQGVFDLATACTVGILDNSDGGKAIAALCPLAVTESKQ